MTACSLSSLIAEVTKPLERYYRTTEEIRADVLARRGRDPDDRFTVEKMKLMVILMVEEILRLGQGSRQSGESGADPTAELHQCSQPSQDSPDDEEQMPAQSRFLKRLAQVLQS